MNTMIAMPTRKAIAVAGRKDRGRRSAVEGGLGPGSGKSEGMLFSVDAVRAGSP
jgi:hypothetical protein